MIGNALRIAAPDIRRIPPVSAFKGADQSATGVGLETADLDLYLNLEADSTYRVLLTFFYTIISGGNVQVRFAAPEPVGTAGGWTLSMTSLGAENGTAPGLGVQQGWAAYSPLLAGTGSMAAAIFTGNIQTTNAGVLQVWSVGYGTTLGASVTTTVNAGSEIDAFKTG